MYAKCPHCGTIFAVTEEHLRQAEGQVRCGHCLAPFNAAESLVDEPVPVPVESTQSITDPSPAPEPVEAELLQFSQESTPASEPEQVVDEPSVVAETYEKVVTDPLPESQPEKGIEKPTEETVSDDSTVLPDLLEADAAELRAKSGIFLRLVQTVAVLVLILLVPAQLAWFMPDEMLRRYPFTREYVEPLLNRVGRIQPQVHNVAKVKLASREVSAHPAYNGALLVQARMVNQAPFPQPYPRLRLTLFDVNGHTIASRDFSAMEYLKEPTRAATDMPRGEQIAMHIELAAPETAAVSYEFNFF